jgi:putative hydrolase of the HAD superfamily
MVEHDRTLRWARQEQTRPPERESRGVIFWDFDGTLAHRPDGWSGTLAVVLLERQPDCAITPRDIAPFLRQGFPWHTPDVGHPHLTSPELWWAPIEQLLASACVSLGIPAATATEAARQARQRYLDTAGWVVYDDVAPALATLAEAGWRHAIVSNHVPELPSLVSALGLALYFDHVLTSAAAGYEKPHPAIYRAALAAAGIP